MGGDTFLYGLKTRRFVSPDPESELLRLLAEEGVCEPLCFFLSLPHHIPLGGVVVIEEKVKEIIAKQLGVNPSEVTAEASFVEDLGADSLDIVELIMVFEESFNIEIPDEDAEKIARVKDAIEYIKKKMG